MMETASKARTILAALLTAATASLAAEVPTDRIIVRLKGDAAQAKSAADRSALARRLSAKWGGVLEPVRVMGDGAMVARLPRRILSSEIRAQFAGVEDAEVIEIVPDRLFQPALVPNDSQYSSQWYLDATSGINAPAAWDVTTGSSSVVIGIIDTGKLPHNELASRWVGGYDFVSLTVRENDSSGGRDADASDPGDWVTAGEAAVGQPLAGCPTTNSRWHGTAMAGAIAAIGNNGAGVAGINWGSKLLPVRVVGKCGGYESDIADGIRWAAGMTVPGVPNNTNIADVLNVSLAAAGACSGALQTAINDANAAGVPVIVAAGNNTLSAGGYSPANCTNVVTVGAVDRNGGKAGYTNFGSAITLSAPGGKAEEHFSGSDSHANQWLVTTSNAGTTSPTGANDYTRLEFGTSIATAQATGVASLVLSVNPALSAAYVKEVLRNTARAFPTNTTSLVPPSQADCTEALCGTGILDAHAAVHAATRWGTTVPRIASGNTGSLLLGSNGIAYVWGYFDYYPDSAQFNPVPVAGLEGVVQVSRSMEHALAVRADGTVWRIGPGGALDRVAGLTHVTAVASGSRYGLALKRDGTVWGWGKNSDGRLGNGTTTDSSVPVMASGLNGVVAIAASNPHRELVTYYGTFNNATSYALKADGTVWSWGHASASVPTQIAGISGATAIAAGEGHLLVLKADGTLWARGRNNAGQLGIGSTVDSNSLVQVSGLSSVSAIAAGPEFSVAVRSDGTLWAWGSINAGQLPAQVAGAAGMTAVAAGGTYGVAYKSDGSVWGWGPSSPMAQVPGVGGTGYLWLAAVLPDFLPVTGATNSTVQQSNPILVTGIANGAAISIVNGTYSIGCTGTFTASAATINPGQNVCVRHTAAANCATTTSATLSIAGLAAKPFSVTTGACDVTPEPFELQTKWGVTPSLMAQSNSVYISGINGPAAISISGGSYSIGCNGTFTAAPGTVTNGQEVCVSQWAPSTANTSSAATLTIGTVSDSFHVITAVGPTFSVAPRVRRNLGIRFDGTLVSYSYPNYRLRLGGVVDGDAGSGHGLAIRSDGTLWGWGSNDKGQVGDGTTLHRWEAKPVTSLAAVGRVAVGNAHSLAMKTDGTVWAWGDNALGQVGDGTTTGRVIPVQVLSGAISISSQYSASFALKSDGSIWAWGNSSLVNSLTPVQIASLAGAATISVGSDHLVVARSDGTVWALGQNSYGQLGNGTTTSSSSLVLVANLGSVVEVAAGEGLTRARKQDGTVWGWGYNYYGQLGDGTTVNRTLPVQLAGVADATGITARSMLRSDGSVWALEGYTPPVRREWGIDGLGYLWLSPGLTSFVPIDDAPTGSVQVSNPLVVTGIANGAAISISAGQYSIGCTGTFTAGPSTINANQTVCVRVTAAADCGITNTATLSIAGLGTRAFSVTPVGSCDWTPYDFSLPSVANAAPGSAALSGAFIHGISGLVPVSVSAGTYSVGCTGNYTASAGTVTDRTSVCVSLLASPTPGAWASAVLTVGTYNASFTAFTAMPASFTTAPRLSYDAGVRSDGALFRFGVDYELGTPNAGRVTSINGVVRASGAVALRSDGSVWEEASGAWTQRSGPTSVTSVVSSMGTHYAIQSNGILWGWGRNDGGRIGDGTYVNRATPVQSLLTGVVDVAPYYDSGLVATGLPGIVLVSPVWGAYALKSDGTVWSLGTTPSQVAGISGASAIAAGNVHLLVLKPDGTVWARGRNEQGQLGNGTTTNSPTSFVPVSGLAGVTAIAANGQSSLALRNDGTVWAWGSTVLVPTQVVGLGSVTGIAGGMALRQDGTVWAVRPGAPALQIATNDGTLLLQLQNTRPNPFTFIPSIGAGLSQAVTSTAITVAGLGNVSSPIAVSGGSYSINGGAFTAAPGTVVNGDTVAIRITSSASYSTSVSATVTIGGPSGESAAYLVRTRDDLTRARGVPQAAAGDSHTYLLASDGVVYAAGYNGNGQLGNGSTIGSSTLRAVSGLGGVAGIASGAFHGVALRNDGTVVTWGSNSVGQLGHGSTADFERNFVAVPGLANVGSVAAGGHHSVARLANGTIWTWGLNSQGQLGDGSSVALRRSPVQVPGITTATAVAAGGRHTLALLFNGTVMAWGANESGQLGNSASFDAKEPVAVPGLANVIAIAAGEAHSLALKSDGTVVAWGFNAFGQIGDGTTTTRRSPVPVSGLGSGVGIITAGANHSLAVKAGGVMFTWGNNANSQIGNGQNTNQLSPVQLPAPSGVVSIAGGARHSSAINSSRRLYVWGDNSFGQVGNRSGNYNPHSATLNVLRGDSLISSGTTLSGGGVGTGSNSGSAVLEVDGQATGFDFGTRAVGSSSTVSGKYANASALEDITGLGISVTGAGFSLATSDCPSQLAPGGQCNFTVGFNSAGSGTFFGELVVQSSVVGSPERRALVGSASSTAAVTFARAGELFAPQGLGQATAAAQHPITNTGSATLSVASVASPLADYTATHNCQSVAPGATCTVDITFKPGAAGARTTQLVVTSNAPGSPHSITVFGTGVGASQPVNPPRLFNIATRGPVLTGDNVMIAGFIIGGSSPKTVLVRARGPSLSQFGVPGVLANPRMDLYSGQTVIASNDNWGDAANAGAVQVTGFAPENSQEAAILTTLTPGGYTAIVSGVGNTTGIAIVEVFEVGEATTGLHNIATRGQTQTGDNVMIAGFIIQGDGPQTVLIRARGPSLTQFGVPGVLPNPKLDLYSGQTVIGSNDNWVDALNKAAIEASGNAPGDANESAILMTLNPGGYTAIVTGVGGGTGVAIVEVFRN